MSPEASLLEAAPSPSTICVPHEHPVNPSPCVLPPLPASWGRRPGRKTRLPA